MFNMPYTSAVVVIKHDTDAQGLNNGCSAIMVGTAGTIHVKMHNDVEVTFEITAGLHPISVKRIYSTGTDAADFTAFWN